MLITIFCELQQNEGRKKFSEKHINKEEGDACISYFISFVVQVIKNEGMLLLCTAIRRNAVMKVSIMVLDVNSENDAAIGVAI